MKIDKHIIARKAGSIIRLTFRFPSSKSLKSKIPRTILQVLAVKAQLIAAIHSIPMTVKIRQEKQRDYNH